MTILLRLLLAAIGLTILPASSFGETPVKEMTSKERQESENTLLAESKSAVQCMNAGDLPKAITHARKALSIARMIYPPAQFPDGHNYLVMCLDNVAYLSASAEEHVEAIAHYEEALALRRKQLAAGKLQGGPLRIAGNLTSIGNLHLTTSAYRKAFVCFEESLAINRELFPKEKYPNGHPSLAGSISWMGRVHREMGSPIRALPYYEESLAMHRQLYPKDKYPKGHEYLAASISNLADLVSIMGSGQAVIPLREESFAMYTGLLEGKSGPKVEARLSIAEGNLASGYSRAEMYDKALPLYASALARTRKLEPADKFPNGSFGTGLLLTNYSEALQNAGRYDEALALMREANTMFKKLFPPAKFPGGHIDIVITTMQLGELLREMGRFDEARVVLDEAQTISRGYQVYLMAGSSEADTPQMAREFMYKVRDGYLSITQPSAETDVGAYRQVWHSKGIISRLLERRHTAARIAAADPSIAEKSRELASVRSRLDQVLQSSMTGAERDKLLQGLTDRKERLELELTRALPELAIHAERDKLGPQDLIKSLPKGTAYIDYLRWTRYTQDPTMKGKKGNRTEDRYLAFVMTPGKPPVRVELGPADVIDKAVKEWRQAIAGRESDAKAAAAVRRLVWEPLIKHVPAEAEILYLSPDGELNRMPFAALPGTESGRVLLEDYALATVPHGPFLLEKLRFPRRFPDGPSEVLAVGDVQYDAPGSRGKGGTWAALPGTAAEIKQVRELIGAVGRLTPLTGANATASNLSRLLPQARYAHIATHGFFRADELEEEEKRLKEFYAKLGKYQFDEKALTARGGAGKRNPLAFVGLVLAHANDPAGAVLPSAVLAPSALAVAPSPVVTGETIVSLQLEGMRLCVLSACESGLGDVSIGDGVHGLQRAIHLAGCSNVVASLWSVSDDATAALMRRFYYHLWEKKEEPLHALRLAQLELFRNPGQVSDLLRGNAPKFSGTTKPLPKGEVPKDADRAATKLWAAFVLSGLGK